MQSVITSVSQAFPERHQYVVPTYQRNYVWTKEDQWEPLWEDVLEVTHSELKRETSKAPHFLGTIITKPSPTHEGFLERWLVVDGQQRLTTLQVMIAAIRSAFTELEMIDIASILEVYLFNKDEVVSEVHDRYKIRHKSKDYSGFSAVIDIGLKDSFNPENSSTKNTQLYGCYNFFRQAACKWIKGNSEGSVKDRANALAKAIIDRLRVVNIRLDEENGHAIFEALNARGEPLTEWEKTKNYFLSIAANSDDQNGDTVYTRYLEKYDTDAYWNQWVTTSRFAGKRIDLFLFFFAQIELPKKRNELPIESEIHKLQQEKLYREFRFIGERKYRKSKEEFQGLLDRMEQYAEIYRRLDRKQKDFFSDYTCLVLNRRETLNLTSLIPLFMVLVQKLGYRNSESIDQAFRIIDSYLMRRVAVKAYYSSFDDVAFDYVQVIRDASEEAIHSVLIDQLENNTTRSNRWPSDQEIIRHLHEADMYNHISSQKRQLLLRGIAEKMHDEKDKNLTMPFSPKDALTVEHVAPQDWKRHWKNDLGYGTTEEDQRKLDKLVNRIGNLTIVTKALNPKLSNHPWKYKAELLADDNLEMNRRLLSDMSSDTWNKNEIERRTELISNYVIQIWPNSSTLREEMGIQILKADTEKSISGISREDIIRLIESVTESGIEDGWIDIDGLNKRNRGDRYGRYVNIGSDGDWYCFWFGVSETPNSLELSGYRPNNSKDILIDVPEEIGFNELLEYTTSKVRETANSLDEF
ncbi:MAG: DUF262 domain-containing HNH endonuclease family protein [Aestuariivita sp.]|nr:DUF262 domain-containing HNH endonuclease family protein [Aestuariivita sp.]